MNSPNDCRSRKSRNQTAYKVGVVHPRLDHVSALHAHEAPQMQHAAQPDSTTRHVQAVYFNVVAAKERTVLALVHHRYDDVLILVIAETQTMQYGLGSAVRKSCDDMEHLHDTRLMITNSFRSLIRAWST